ncbi:MAG TPA: hypothetical protein VK338_01565, partial [Candidatus Nitrosocosmicus sp.]|nr:hypothetical protein [Candidatus Nitrosocosmicus sp.]
KSETKEKTEGKGDILKVAPFMIGSAGHDLLEYALVYGSIPEHPIGPEDGFWRTLYKTEPAKYQAIVNGLKEITHDFYDELQLSPTTLSTYLTEIYFGQSRQTQKAMKEKEESGLWQISDIPTYEKTEGIHSDDYITASARTDVINLTSESEQPEVAACLEAVNDLVQREKVSFGKRAMHDIHTFTEDEVKTMKQLTHFILDGTINVRFIEMKFQCNAENNFDPNPTEELYDDVAHSLFAIRELLGVFSPEVFEEENMAKFLSHIKAYVAYGYLPAFDYTNKFPVAPKKVDHKLVRLSWPLIAQHFVKVPEKILKKKGAIPV